MENEKVMKDQEVIRKYQILKIRNDYYVLDFDVKLKTYIICPGKYASREDADNVRNNLEKNYGRYLHPIITK
jgi:hypothetical protein